MNVGRFQLRNCNKLLPFREPVPTQRDVKKKCSFPQFNIKNMSKFNIFHRRTRTHKVIKAVYLGQKTMQSVKQFCIEMPCSSYTAVAVDSMELGALYSNTKHGAHFSFFLMNLQIALLVF